MAEFVAFDLETTGLSPKADTLIEVGALRFSLDAGGERELEVLVDPGRAIPLAVQRLTGIGATDVAGQASAVEALGQLAVFADGAELIGHGAAFDLAFCAQLAPESFAHRPVLDTLELARILLPLATSHALGALATLLDLPHLRPHRALSDATATAALFRALLRESATIGAATLRGMRRVAAQAPGTPLHRFFELAAGEIAPASGVPRPAPAPAWPPEAPPSPSRPPDRRAAEDSLEAASAALFSPGGGLAERPGYEYREAQVQMVRAVAQSLERGGRLAVEAGTGVGKTLGYLVPLALWVERSGRRATVATHTTNLQDQIAGDLPRLLPLLPGPLRWSVLKGRSHYLSLRRFQRWLGRGDAGPRGADLEAIRFKLKLLRWLELTRSGDRAELRLSAVERDLWRHVESDAGDCLGGACAHWVTAQCPMVAARRAASGADLVITNHALLLSDGGEGEPGVLGEYEALVVDEAHHLEEAATRAAGRRLLGADVARTVDRLPEIVEPGLGGRLEACRDAVHRLFGEAKGLLTERLGGGDGARSGTLSLTPEVRAEPRLHTLVRAAQRATATLRQAALALRAADPTTALAAELLPQPDLAALELGVAAQALEGCATAIEDVLLVPRPGHVAWLELRAEQAELHDAPVSVAAGLGEGLLDRCRTTLLTSATLAVAGDFRFIRERLGLRSRTEELALGSPYDYLAQALCVLVTDIPAYDAPEYEAALAALAGAIAERLQGRTLGLFTSYAALRRIRDLAARRLGAAQIAVLGQGIDGTRRQLLTSFLQSPRTLLLGTASFWEGIDIPGDALRCVIIAKLPFAVPSDPLVRARTEGLRDPFGQYVLPDAVIRLRQGFGRLIRSGADRGAVVIADSRLLSRDYGRRFLEALPPAAVAREGAAGVAARVVDFVSAR